MNSPSSMTSAASLPADLSVPIASLGRGAKAAHEFEAQLIASVLASMEKTFGGLPGNDLIPGADNYNYLGTQAFSQALAEKGGFGIASLILQHLPLHEGEHQPSPAATPTPEQPPKVLAHVADGSR